MPYCSERWDGASYFAGTSMACALQVRAQAWLVHSRCGHKHGLCTPDVGFGSGGGLIEEALDGADLVPIDGVAQVGIDALVDIGAQGGEDGSGALKALERDVKVLRHCSQARRACRRRCLRSCAAGRHFR